MQKPLIEVDTTVYAEAKDVWRTLTAEKSAMFMGAKVDTDWQEGSPINISGEFHGTEFNDHGEIRAAEPPEHLAFTHFSGSQRENGNLVDIRLEPRGERTQVTLSQTPQGGERPDDARVAEFRKNWEAMLGMLKTAAEEKALAEA